MVVWFVGLRVSCDVACLVYYVGGLFNGVGIAMLGYAWLGLLGC